MRNRIRNILTEALILESPLFRAVAIKVNDQVYEGEPWMTHGHLIMHVLEDEAEDNENRDDDTERDVDVYEYAESVGCVDGFITRDGEFVSREDAKQMVSDPESFAMKSKGELAYAKIPRDW